MRKEPAMRKWVSVMHTVDIIQETPAGNTITYTASVTKDESPHPTWVVTVFDKQDRVISGPSRFVANTPGDAIQFADEQLTRWGYSV